MKGNDRKTSYLIRSKITLFFAWSGCHFRYYVITVRFFFLPVQCSQYGYRQLYFRGKVSPKPNKSKCKQNQYCWDCGSTRVAARMRAIKKCYGCIIKMPWEFWHLCRSYPLLMEEEQRCGCLCCLKANGIMNLCVTGLHNMCMCITENIRHGYTFLHNEERFLTAFWFCAWICYIWAD